MRLSLKRNGFSLVEAVVAGVIFSVAVTGVFAALSSVKKPAGDTDKAVGAAYCGQQFLEGLRANVDSRDWISGKLAPGSGIVTCPQNGITYTINYTIANVPGTTARQARLSVSWP